VRCIVLARPTKSDALLAQIVGRALRPAEGKNHALLIDMSGSFEDLGLPEHLGLTDLHGRPGRRLLPKVRRLPARCPECSRLHDRSSKTCSTCGWAYSGPTPADRLRTAAENLRASDRWPRQRVWRGLLWWANEHGLSEKWCLANFHELFGDWPTGISKTPSKPDREVREWIEAARSNWQSQRKHKAA